MLIEFSVSNFRSIREKQAVSFVASSSKEHEGSHVFNPKTPGVDRLLRSAVVYGANAAGKSNLLRALDVMQDILLLKNQVDQELPTTPFLLDGSASQPSTFEVVFIVDSVKYQYGFECTRTRVTAEWLFAFPEKRAQKWFHRQQAEEGGEVEWEFGPSLKGSKKSWAAATRSNALFLTTAIQLKADQLLPIFAWFRDKLRVVVGSGLISSDYSIEMIGKGAERISALLRTADSGIVDLEIFKKAPSDTFREIALKALPEDVHDKIIDSVSKAVRAKHLSSDGKEVWIDMDDESEGTKKLFACAGPFLDVLSEGRVLVIDELNNSLHPIMVKWIVDTFNNAESNANNAQLFFATHATSILSLEIFRRDQIWFAEKSSEGATSIYPLTDFNPRKEALLSKGYLQGRFGAVPFLSGGQLFHE